MLASSRTHHLPPHSLADLVRRHAGGLGTGSSSGEPSAQSALLAHLAGLALGAALVLGATAVAALGLGQVLP